MSMPKKFHASHRFFEKLPGKLMIKNVRVVDTEENLDAVRTIIIYNGKITDILDKAPSAFDGEVFASENSVLMPGFFDMHVHFREPGREDEETLESGSYTAANGGFTGVACMPNTEPAIDNQEVINFILEESKDFLVDIYPVAAVTKARAGNELAPIAEMVEAGAVAISDDGSPIMNAEIMRRALEYSKMFDIPILGHEEDANLSHNRHMHEGFFSTKLGLQGIPSLSEEILVARDIMLTEFTGGKFHVCHISSAGSVELVRQAKSKGLAVTCEVTPHHFTLTDKEVESFDTNTKMNPPLRSKQDVQAILEGLKDGTIDVIATDHAPHSHEEKEAEYIYAPFGITGLETALGLILAQLYKTKIISLKDIYDRCVKNPRKILNLDLPRIKKGKTANLTYFSLDDQWIHKQSVSFSKSKNTPFGQHPLMGRTIAVINKGKIFRTPPLK